MKELVNNRVNLVFAIYLAIMPIVSSFVGLFDLNFQIPYQIVAWGICYFVCLVISLANYLRKGNKVSFKTKNPLVIIAFLMLAWIVISSVVNSSFNIYLMIYFAFFLIAICFCILDKKNVCLVINIFLITIAISCIMGFIDARGDFIAGFNNKFYPLSLHFGNPNYSAYVVGVALLACFVLFDKSKSITANVFYGVLYIIFATHLFMNGSFTPITAVFITEIFVLIFLAIKFKKCHYKMLALLILLIPICLLVDLIPNIESIRTCKYNYFVECVAVFDNIFNTNALKTNVQGSDGWDRKALMINSLKHSVSSFKTFVFGSGAGFFYELRPHDTILSLLLDFGVVMPILCILFLIYLFIRVLKMKFNFNRLYLCVNLIFFLLCSFMASLNCYHYAFAMVLGLLIKSVFKNDDEVLDEPPQKVKQRE